jgi:hypothetical protein
MMNRSNNQRGPRLPGGPESVPLTARRQGDADGAQPMRPHGPASVARTMKIDLSTENAVAFRKQLAPFLKHARKAGRVQLHRPAQRGQPPAQRRYPGPGRKTIASRSASVSVSRPAWWSNTKPRPKSLANQRPAPGANQTQFQVLMAFVRSG